MCVSDMHRGQVNILGLSREKDKREKIKRMKGLASIRLHAYCII